MLFYVLYLFSFFRDSNDKISYYGLKPNQLMYDFFSATIRNRILAGKFVFNICQR
ncbi:Uncharacterized protein dnm_035740 [Desulfonema magnum]|uniref:Uncharacterized protein n=1 Tax=Desulfonema magnum TaxID=45655 RepID=A0A975GN96_9BACT|nr:Uncharacterized protein dnm_035740 [Desulfonema magnum]